ncbi:MAG: class I SAM-dependent methyltransferase [Deltaproteobacteria bacterium]|nr:class I SAM-dependent methyltransferase [Deltaproteobacteria bacterium]
MNFLPILHSLVFPQAAALLREPTPLPPEEMEQILARSAQIDGFLFGREPVALLHLAHRMLARCPGKGAVVEIGSFRGKSTVLLAATAKRSQGVVVCVDPFMGSPEHAALLAGSSTYPQFEENLRDFLTQGIVRPVRLPSDDAIAQVPEVLVGRTVTFLFIDGLHTYEQVKRDFDNYFPLLADGGVVAFHDTAGSHPGSTRFVLEIARHHPDTADFNLTGTLTYCTKKRRARADAWNARRYCTAVWLFLALQGRLQQLSDPALDVH